MFENGPVISSAYDDQVGRGNRFSYPGQSFNRGFHRLVFFQTAEIQEGRDLEFEHLRVESINLFVDTAFNHVDIPTGDTALFQFRSRGIRDDTKTIIPVNSGDRFLRKIYISAQQEVDLLKNGVGEKVRDDNKRGQFLINR